MDYDILVSLDKTKKLKMADRDSRLNKINMICNTLSLSNLDDKAKDLEKVIDTNKPTLLLAHHIVFKRITIAQNSGNEVFYRLI